MAEPDPMPADLSGNLGNTKSSAERVSKEASLSSASKKGRKRNIKLKDESIDCRVVRTSSRLGGRARGSRNNNTGRGRLHSGTLLRYLMHIWDAFPEDKVKSSTYIDPMWFNFYEYKSATALSWIKKEGIFSKKYVFVPIVKWSHWNLLIICNLGESLDSKTNAPCMLLLDSLQAAGPSWLEPLIRRFLVGIYESEERTESKKQLLKIPLLIPKVPQQKDGDACGFYVLYFIRLFVERAPETFNISERYPNLTGKNWFTDEEVESFSEALDVLPAVVSDHDPTSNESSDSVKVIMTPFPDN